MVPEGAADPVELFPLPPTVLPTSVKLAQVIRVVFAKWTTKERLPKKAPIPFTVEANSSE